MTRAHLRPQKRIWSEPGRKPGGAGPWVGSRPYHVYSRARRGSRPPRRSLGVDGSKAGAFPFNNCRGGQSTVMPRRLLLRAVVLTLTTSIPLRLLTMAASPRIARRLLRRSPIPVTRLLPWRPKARIPTNTCYDSSHGSPAQKQVIQVPNTYNGIVLRSNRNRVLCKRWRK